MEQTPLLDKNEVWMYSAICLFFLDKFNPLLLNEKIIYKKKRIILLTYCCNHTTV